MRAAPAALAALSAAGLVSCAASAPTLVTASPEGCTPARMIYQPGINGRPGTHINLPGNCPSPAQVRQAEQAAAVAAAAEPPDTRPAPPPLPSAEVAVRNGVERLCAWLYSDAEYSLPAFQQAAFDAGYRRGSSVDIIPLPEMRRAASFSSLAFQAVIAGAPAEGSGVAAFASFHDPVCQIQVYNYGADAERYLARLTATGWTRVGTESRPSQNVRAERFFGGPAGRRMTLVVNRWAGRTPAPGGLAMILNIVPGEDRARGVLD